MWTCCNILLSSLLCIALPFALAVHLIWSLLKRRSGEIMSPYLESCYPQHKHECVTFIQKGCTGVLTAFSFFPPPLEFGVLKPGPLSVRFGIIQSCTWMWVEQAAPPLLHRPWGHLFSIIGADWSHARCESCRVGGCLYTGCGGWGILDTGACGCQWRNKASNLAQNCANANVWIGKLHYDRAVKNSSHGSVLVVETDTASRLSQV